MDVIYVVGGREAFSPSVEHLARIIDFKKLVRRVYVLLSYMIHHTPLIVGKNSTRLTQLL